MGERAKEERTRRVLVGLVEEVDRLVEGERPDRQLVLVDVVQQDRVLRKRERQVRQALKRNRTPTKIKWLQAQASSSAQLFGGSNGGGGGGQCTLLSSSSRRN